MQADHSRTRSDPGTVLNLPHQSRQVTPEHLGGDAPLTRLDLRPVRGAASVQTGERVLVAAYANWEGLSRTPWLFTSAGWEVDAFTRAHTFLSRSAHLQTLQLGAEGLVEFVDQLRDFLAEHGARYARVVIGDDPLLWELARRREQPWARRLLPCDGSDRAIDFLVSKIEFIRLCAQAGLPVPASQICRGRAAVLGAAAVLGTARSAVLPRCSSAAGCGASTPTGANAPGASSAHRPRCASRCFPNCVNCSRAWDASAASTACAASTSSSSKAAAGSCCSSRISGPP